MAAKGSVPPLAEEEDDSDLVSTTRCQYNILKFCWNTVYTQQWTSHHCLTDILPIFIAKPPLKSVIIGSDNGLPSVRCQAIPWINDDWCNWRLRTDFMEVWIHISLVQAYMVRGLWIKMWSVFLQWPRYIYYPIIIDYVTIRPDSRRHSCGESRLLCQLMTSCHARSAHIDTWFNTIMPSTTELVTCSTLKLYWRKVDWVVFSKNEKSVSHIVDIVAY